MSTFKTVLNIIIMCCPHQFVIRFHSAVLLPTGSEERRVLGVGSIPVAILPPCQDMKTIGL